MIGRYKNLLQRKEVTERRYKSQTETKKERKKERKKRKEKGKKKTR